MNINQVDEPPSSADCAVAAAGFWQRMTQAIDELFVNRIKRAVPEATLRRSRIEVRRRRQLMLKAAPATAHRLDGGERR